LLGPDFGSAMNPNSKPDSKEQASANKRLVESSPISLILGSPRLSTMQQIPEWLSKKWREVKHRFR
jgi:hypothetical protein